MSQKILLDTNILVYAFDRQSRFHTEAIKVFEQEKLYTTQNNICEFYRTMTSPAYKKLVTIEEVINATNFYKSKLKVLYPTSNSDIILSDLIETFKPLSGQIWDTLMLAQAIENDLTKIYTKNTKDFPQNLQIQIIDPTL